MVDPVSSQVSMPSLWQLENEDPNRKKKEALQRLITDQLNLILHQQIEGSHDSSSGSASGAIGGTGK